MKITTSILLSVVLSALVGSRAILAIGNDNPTGPTGSFNGEITTACSYDAYTGNGKRVIDDLIVTGAVGAYPLKWTRVLNTRYVSTQNLSTDGGFGSGGWDYSYHWVGWVHFEPYPPPPCYGECAEYEGADAHIDYPDGRSVDFYQNDPNPNVYHSWVGSEPGDRLVRDLGDNGWNLKLKDGGVVHFAPTTSSGNPGLFSQRITDPYGQVTTFQRDGLGRLSRIVEPAGRYLQINYEQYWLNVGSGGYYGNFIKSVQAFPSASATIPSETVTYNYTQVAGTYTVYYLTQVDYGDGGHAYYTYQSSNAGSTGNPLIKTCHDVRYAGPMSQIEYVFEQAGASYGVAWGQVKAEKNVPSGGQPGQIVSQVQYPVFSPGYVPPPGNTALQTRVEIRGDGRSRTFLYGTGGTGPEDTGLGILNTYTDFKNQQSELTKIFQNPSPPDVLGGGIRTTIKAPLSRITYVDRDWQTGVVKKVTYPGPNGDYTFSTYDNDGGLDPAPVYMASQRDEKNRMTYYTRNSVTHAVTKISYGCLATSPPGTCPTEEFTYNGFGQVLTHKLTTGGTEYFYYDEGLPTPRGLKTRHVDAEGNPTLFEYYTSGPHTDRLKKVTDPRLNPTTYEYNLRGQVTKVIHADTTYTQSSYNPDGTLAWSADENHPGASSDQSQRTRWTYDEYKRVLTVTLPTNEPPTTNSYGLNPITWGDPLLHTTNNVKYTISPGGKNVVYDYDENLRKVGQTVALNTPDVAHTTFEFDPFGNVTKTIDPRGKETTFGYDGRDRKIWMRDAIATDRNDYDHTMDWLYDGVGNKIKETRADNAFRTWQYEEVNPLNRLERTVDWMITGEPEVATVYGRNVTSTIETITDAKGKAYTFTFDTLHRKRSETYPAAAGNSNPTEYFVYDAAGNLSQYYNPSSQIKTMSYDNRNRLLNFWWSAGGGKALTYTYDAASRMTSVVTGMNETTVAFGYDDANRKIYEDQTLAGFPTHRVMSDLDADGNRENLQVPGVYLVHYDYTPRNQLSHIYQASGGVFFSYNYDAAGNMLKRKNEWGGVNDSTNCAYDDLNRPTMWEQTGPGDAWFARSRYQYDKVNREVATWRDEDGSKGERFWFSTNNQVTTAKYKADLVWTGNPLNEWRAVSYTYTPDMLNRQSVTDNGVTINYTVNDANQYGTIGGQTLGYDGNFNLTSYNGGSYTFDSANYLTSANNNAAQFTYDGLGRCVKRTINGLASVFVFDGWKPILEFDGAGNAQVWNIYGPGSDEILLRITNSTLVRYHSDRQGNVAFLLDGSGYGSEKYTYDAFGKPTITDWNGNGRTQSAVGNRFMYTGREWIGELGIYDYRNRMYLPGLGRFLQTDPKGFDAGDMNLFRYCGDDPVDRTDPMGLTWESEGYTFTPAITNIPNIYVTREFHPGASGVTFQRLWLDAKPIQLGPGTWGIDYKDVQVRSHSYIRTHKDIPFKSRTEHRLFERIVQTTFHEGRQQFVDKGYYDKYNGAIRQDVTAGRYSSEKSTWQAIHQKEEFYKSHLIDKRREGGREVQRRDGMPAQASSNPRPPDGLTKMDDVLTGGTGGIEGEGTHPPAVR